LTRVRKRVIDHVEVDACLERWRLHIFECDFLYLDIDFGCGCIRDELSDDFVPAVFVEDAIGELSVKEVEGFRKVVLDRVTIPLVIEGAELCEKILRFGILGFVFEVV
jgi:hypothetical protein